MMPITTKIGANFLTDSYFTANVRKTKRIWAKIIE